MNRIVLEFVTIPLGQNCSRQDSMVWKKILFPDLLKRQTWGRLNGRQHEQQAEKQKRLAKNYWLNDTDREEQEARRVAILCWELFLYKS